MKIAIASGKGGTGKTFVSTNLFYVAQAKGLHVCLVDCDVEEPNVLGFCSGELNYKTVATQKIPQINTSVCTFCAKCSEYCAYNAITVLPNRNFIQVSHQLCHSCGACLLACKFNAITETDMPTGEITSIRYSDNSEIIEGKINIGIERPSELIKQIQKKVATHYDIVFFDSPPGTSCPFIATAENADAVLLVAEPTPFGLNDLKLSVEVLQTINKPLFAIINKDGMGNNETEIYLQSQNIEIVAKIPFDIAVAQIYSIGKLVSIENKTYRDIFTQAVEKILKK